MGENNLITICSTLLLVIILGGTFTLAWHTTISGDQALALIGGISTAALAIFGVHTGVKAGASAAATPTQGP